MPSKQITLEDIELLREISPRRRRFSDNPVVYERMDGRHVVSTHFPSVDRLLHHDTAIVTINGPYGPYRFLTDSEEIRRALEWQEKHKNFVFLRDMLDFSIALDYNLAEAGVYTELGLAEHKSKADGHKPSINVLARSCVRAIATVAFYQQSDVVCAVPPSPDKERDLPTEIARLVSERSSKPDISDAVSFAAPKKSVKAVSLAEKWDVLKSGNFPFVIILFVAERLCS